MQERYNRNVHNVKRHEYNVMRHDYNFIIFAEGGGFSAERQKSTLCLIPTKLCMVIPMDMPNKRIMQKQVIV